MPTLLSNYHLKDIYNADEFGLFYECLPSKSLHLKSEKCVGGKHSKVRLTGMAAANAVGDKLPMFIIGKSKKPRCFAGIQNLPCRYRGQGKSWIERNLFEEWVRELDSKFLAERRKIALLVDNCPAHPHVDNLKAIDLIFLPPKTTASTQSMDQGVIRSLKAKYRVFVVQKYIRALDRKMPLPKINIISAMNMLVTAWSMVTKTTVINCFTKAGMSEALQEQALQDDDDPFKDLIEEVEIQRGKNRDTVPLNVTAEDFVAVDDEVIATEPLASEEEILTELRGEDILEIHDEEICDDPLSKPTQNELRNAMDLVFQYCLFSSNGDELRQHSLILNEMLESEFTEQRKQSTLDSYLV